MRKSEFFRGLTRIVTDSLAGACAWSLAYYIRPWTDLIPNIKFHFPLESLPSLSFFIPFVGCSIAGMILIFLSLSLYSYPAKYFSSQTFASLVWGVCLWVLGIVAVYALAFHELVFSRIMLAHAAIFTIIFASIFRGILHILWIKIFPLQRNAIVFGNEKDLEYFHSSFHSSDFSVITANNAEESIDSLSLENISDIFFFELEDSSALLKKVREMAAEKGKILHIIPSYAEEFWGHAHFEVLRGVPMITSSPVQQNHWLFALKRTFDIITSFILILLFLPLFAIVAVLIKINSSGPVFYISQRVGRNGQLFPMYKFRSMGVDADARKEKLAAESHREGPLFKIKNDPRVTSMGRWLRKTSIDELPQCINVLKGDMSLIGPRPHLPDEVAQYGSAQRRILSVRPGISGLAQVSGRSDLSFEREMFLDAYYCENMSFWMDIRIFIKTPFVLLFGKGAD